MKITVIGIGLIGGSMALDLKNAGFATEIIGVDINEDHIQEAIQKKIIDRSMYLHEAIPISDIIILAVPVDKIVVLLPKVLDMINPFSTVIDVGSTKKVIADSIKNHPMRSNYVGTHPMSGTENSGTKSIEKGLFNNKITIICDQKNCHPQHVALIEKMYHSLGMSITHMDSDEQDHSTAFVSHLPHAVAFALSNAVLSKEDRKIIFDLASGGFRSTVRLAKSSPDTWVPIFQQNREYLYEALKVYIKHLEWLAKSINDNDEKAIFEHITHASHIRSILDKSNAPHDNKT